MTWVDRMKQATVEYAWLDASQVSEATQYIGWVSEWSTGADGHPTVQCSYRTRFDFGRVDFSQQVWKSEFGGMDFEARAPILLKLCALLHLHIKNERREYLIQNGGDINRVDNFSRLYFVSTPGDSDGCKLTFALFHAIKVCQKMLNVRTYRDSGLDFTLTLPHATISHAGALAWDLPLKWRAEPPLPDDMPENTSSFVATRESENVSRRGGFKTIRIDFTCETADLGGKWAIYTYQRSFESPNGPLSITDEERGASQHAADLHCAQVYKFVMDDPFIRDVILHGY